MKLKGHLSWSDGLKIWLLIMLSLWMVKTVFDKQLVTVTEKVDCITHDEIVSATPLQIIESCASKHLSEDGGVTLQPIYFKKG